ncbi:MAG: endo-arabinase [Bacteroidota bacterium]|nr:endo-arabinase [Bacteroidota bacterium]
MKKNILFIFLASLILLSFQTQSNDSDAIIKLLEKESATWRSGDVKAHADCWQIRPYSRILVSLPDGTTLDILPENMIKPSSAMGQGGVSKNTNYKMNISGNNAWISHNEESTSKEGKKTYSYEIRILEKINGQWKLVGQSIHIYDPSKK